jgi:hypothetical protein
MSREEELKMDRGVERTLRDGTLRSWDRTKPDRPDKSQPKGRTFNHVER